MTAQASAPAQNNIRRVCPLFIRDFIGWLGTFHQTAPERHITGLDSGSDTNYASERKPGLEAGAGQGLLLTLNFSGMKYK